MMISRFHKLIQSRVFWIVFVGLVCISMIGFGSYATSANASARERAAIGRLYGENIQYPEFRGAYSELYLYLLLSAGTYINITAPLEQMLEENAWKRLAMLRKAERLGLRVSADEVTATIRSHPFFQQQGAFDPALYQHLIESVLPRLGMSASALETLFRNETLIRKLLFLPAQAALVTPAELRDAFHLYSDRFVLEYAGVGPELIADTVADPDEGAVRRYYEENSEAFRLPEKVRVRCAVFPVADFMGKAQVEPEAALDYYNRNLSRYVLPAGETNATETVYAPFESVEPEIVGQLRQNEALRLAMERATEMVIDLAPGRDGQAPGFDEMAEKNAVRVLLLPPFAETDAPPQGIRSPGFVRAAFALDETPENYFSDAVQGEEATYVLALDKRFESFIPPFEAVLDSARAGARQQADRQALAEKAQTLFNQFQTSEKQFAEAAQAAGLVVNITPEFGLFEGLPENPQAGLLIQAAAGAEQGALIGPLRTDDRYLLVSVKERIPGDLEAGLPALREDLTFALQRRKADELMREWQDFVLKQAGFEDFRQDGE